MDRRGQNRQLKSVEPVAGRKLDAKTPADQSNEPSPKPIGERKKNKLGRCDPRGADHWPTGRGRRSDAIADEKNEGGEIRSMR